MAELLSDLYESALATLPPLKPLLESGKKKRKEKWVYRLLVYLATGEQISFRATVNEQYMHERKPTSKGQTRKMFEGCQPSLHENSQAGGQLTVVHRIF